MDLLENHLEFLSTHRGSIHRDRSLIAISSDRPEFTFAIPTADFTPGSEAPYKTLYLYPWAKAFEPMLAERGYASKASLNYMTLSRDPSSWSDVPGLSIEKAETSKTLALFSEVQCRGFLENPEAYASWASWLSAANQRNLNNPSQSFYVGTLQGEAAGVVLLVKTGDIGGIYAVATLPSARKKGISTALMKHAVFAAKKAGCTRTLLQVASGSYAESFYRKLGFESAYHVSIHVRN